MSQDIRNTDGGTAALGRASVASRQSLRTQVHRLTRALGLALLIGPAFSAHAADPLDIGLEELLATEVTGASRKPQRLRDVAASVYVLSREDIARSGATSVPDVLRLVPGVQVAHVANGRWAVSVRGFNGRFANKLQVLMDGRSLYSPLFAGVLWETEDTLIEDIERIEVIRGPGAAQWGANAVNGVINIVTRKARDTQGDLVTGAVGSDRTELGVRHGAASGDGHYRLWAKALANPDSPALGGGDANDNRRAARMGYRGDWLSDSGKQLSVIGGAYANTMADRYKLADFTSASLVTLSDRRQRNKGAHLLARQQMNASDGSRVSVQAYVETGRMQITDFIDEVRTTADLEFEHQLRMGERHDIVWGAEIRQSRDRIEGAGILSIDPEQHTSRLASLFLHDDISVVPERFNLALGVRLDHEKSSGLEVQPSARMIWTPSATQSIWASVARASRLPSRAEQDITIDFSVEPPNPQLPAPALIRNVPPPGHSIDSEILEAAEIGYRSVFGDAASVDISLFRNRYHKLRGIKLDSQDFSNLFAVPSFVVLNLIPANEIEARSTGLEIAGEIQVTPWWRLQPVYSLLRVKAWSTNSDATTIRNALLTEGVSPRYQASLRSTMNFSKRRQFDVVIRHVARTHSNDTPEVDAYTVFDARYAVRPTERLELALVGRNLGPKRHGEAISDLLPAQATEVERSAFVTAKWEF